MARRDRVQKPRGRSLGGTAFRWVPVVLVLVLLGGAAAAYHYDLGTRWFGAAPDPGPTSPPVPGLTLPSVPSPRAVARPAPAGRPAPSSVRRHLSPALDDPDLAELRAVVAPLSGPPVLDDGTGVSMPASTLKLLTAATALEVLGPGHTFATRVVAQGRRSLTLVGGGDPYLTSKRPKGPGPPRRQPPGPGRRDRRSTAEPRGPHDHTLLRRLSLLRPHDQPCVAGQLRARRRGLPDHRAVGRPRDRARRQPGARPRRERGRAVRGVPRRRRHRGHRQGRGAQGCPRAPTRWRA